MPPSFFRIRRAQRTDFSQVMCLFSATDAPLPPPSRATLRRYRNLVNDLGSDLYLATVDVQVVGLVHVTYARQVTRPSYARMETIVVAKGWQRHGIGAALLDFAVRRARKRGCVSLSCTVAPDQEAARSLLTRAGLRAAGHRYELAVCDEKAG
jgi:ribosomal protein S18 acetylase RimI-like enzyme